MRDMEATEQTSLPGMFCTHAEVIYSDVIYNAFNLMFLSLIADDFNHFQEQRNEL